jgi:hypothetical protein
MYTNSEFSRFEIANTILDIAEVMKQQWGA